MERIVRWGALEPLDALRRPLPWPDRLLILGPVGLGDIVATLPAVRRIPSRTRLTWIGRANHRAVVGMMGVHDFRASDDSASLDLRDFDAILSFADVGAGYLAASERVATVPTRIGRAAARSRPRWYNHLVHSSRFGWPRHEAQRNLRLLLPFGQGATASDEELRGAHPLEPASALLPEDLPTGGYIVLHPFSMGHGREWPIRHWIAAARLLAEDSGLTVVFTGSAAERDRLTQAWPRAQRPAGVIDAGGRLDTAQLSVLLHRAGAVAACSTGPLHLAAALGTPALGMYAPRKGVALDRWAPLGRAAAGVQSHRRCPHGLRCANDDCRCMAELEPQHMASALRPGSRRALNLAPLAPYVLTSPPAVSSHRANDGAAHPGDLS